jgi:hypothetical protein
MSLKLASLFAVTFALACGGTTQGSIDNTNDGGTSQGGTNAAGTSSGGTHSGGTSSGGTHSGGTVSAGAGGTGGSIVTGGDAGAGGSLTYDPRCPPRAPMGGACDFNPALDCEYNYFSGCLCYDSANMFSICQQVDPTCMYQPPSNTGGTGGASQMAAPAPSEAGAGGITAKVALPPQKKCMCAPPPPGTTDSGMWTCTP